MALHAKRLQTEAEVEDLLVSHHLAKYCNLMKDPRNLVSQLHRDMTSLVTMSEAPQKSELNVHIFSHTVDFICSKYGVDLKAMQKSLFDVNDTVFRTSG